jgi:peptidoglycan hydrolase-like protein with peptidoglycan-binding domain
MLPLLKIGDSGEFVKYSQNLLNARMPELAALWVDGQFGVKTDLAVLRFQMKKLLKVDGKIGDQTWAALEAGPPPIDKRPRIPLVIETHGGGV